MAIDTGLEDTLCSVCQCIVLPWKEGLPERSWRFRHRKILEILQYAQLGCRLCVMLETMISRDLATFSPKETWAIELSVSARDNYLITVTFIDGQRQFQNLGSLDISGFEYFDETTTFPAIKSLVVEPNSPAGFDLARFWLSECVEDHTCMPKVDVPLPTRLINIEGADPDIIQIVVLPEGTTGRYTALSYCWGEANASTTTPATLPDRMNGFNLSELPRTLRDAIKITRELGLQYIWIDAVCILQGDEEIARQDWERESARMENVYSNAYVTLCAAASSHCDGGLFLPQTCRIPCSSSSSRADSTLQFNRTGSVILSQTLFSSQFKDEPINRRAWALQERLLSPRLLFYTRKGIFWQCDSSQKSPTSNSCRDGYFTDNECYRLPMKSSEIAKKDWVRIMREYSSRSLTQPLDKLPAVSALARRYSVATGDTYVCGLWKNSLLEDLLWIRRVTSGLAISRRGTFEKSQDLYRAPTWSWASCDGEIDPTHTYRVDAEFSVKVMECKVELVNEEDPFGMVKHAFLVLKGPMKKATRLDWTLFKAPAVFGLRDPNDEDSEFEIGQAWPSDQDDKAIEMAKQAGEIWLLLLTKKNFYYCLVLIPAPGNSGEFQRIALLESWGSEQQEWFESAVESTVTII